MSKLLPIGPAAHVLGVSARLYGSRSHQNQKLLDGVCQAVKEARC
jgi:predicted site-specific integrase-resolvase